MFKQQKSLLKTNEKFAFDIAASMHEEGGKANLIAAAKIFQKLSNISDDKAIKWHLGDIRSKLIEMKADDELLEDIGVPRNFIPSKL